MKNKSIATTTSSTSIQVLLPLHYHDPKIIERWVSQAQQDKEVRLRLSVSEASRVVWMGLEPILWNSDRSRGRNSAVSLLMILPWNFMIDDELITTSPCSRVDPTDQLPPYRGRSFRCPRFFSEVRKITIWIEPPHITRLEYSSFMARLITWEHILLRAQSISGYIATLGGGFFLCHHYQTAIVLARQQQEMAVVLNDPGMYYRCLLNTAYSFIYAGYFAKAKRLIRHVWDILHPAYKDGSSNKGSPMLALPNESEARVLFKMCHSAWLLAKRMKLVMIAQQQEQHLSGTVIVKSRKGEQAATMSKTTIDNYARVRVNKDRSLDDDLLIPFGGRECRITVAAKV